VAVHRDWEALIQDPQIEAIAVATPNHLHAPIAIAALEAGKHVLLEKPMANTIADCDRIVAAARASRAQLSVGLQCRLSPQWGRIRALIDEGAIGRPQHVHVSLFRHPYRQGSAAGVTQGPASARGSWRSPSTSSTLRFGISRAPADPSKCRRSVPGSRACSPRFPCS
jgi:myo-inositol 2-dehydrogenase/D-chiro-inositol 1-dehydrogenase